MAGMVADDQKNEDSSSSDSENDISTNGDKTVLNFFTNP